MPGSNFAPYPAAGGYPRLIEVNELRNGVTFELDGALYRVIDYSHHKPGRGKATIRTKVRDLRTGTTLEKTFNSGDRVQDVRLDYHEAQFLYREGDLYYFMVNETYEQPAFNESILQDQAPFLTEGMEVKLTLYGQEPLDVEIPSSVNLTVAEAEMGVKGDTATGATKSVTLETGLQVQVPLFIEQGDVVRVDTRSGEYVTRVT